MVSKTIGSEVANNGYISDLSDIRAVLSLYCYTVL